METACSVLYDQTELSIYWSEIKKGNGYLKILIGNWNNSRFLYNSYRPNGTLLQDHSFFQEWNGKKNPCIGERFPKTTFRTFIRTIYMALFSTVAVCMVNKRVRQIIYYSKKRRRSVWGKLIPLRMCLLLISGHLQIEGFFDDCQYSQA